MQKIVEHLAKEADKRSAEELIEAQIKVMAAAYEKASAYTNLIIVAGYASFFGLWQITKGLMSEKQVLWSALLISISASVFVFFEVTKTFFQSKQLQELNKIITDPRVSNSFSALRKAFDEHNLKVNRQIVYWGYWWHFAWIASVAAGVSAIGILMWAFVSGLFRP